LAVPSAIRLCTSAFAFVVTALKCAFGIATHCLALWACAMRALWRTDYGAVGIFANPLALGQTHLLAGSDAFGCLASWLTFGVAVR